MASNLRAVLAPLKKNGMLKGRNNCSACCELLLLVSLVYMFLIVFGYFLSEDVSYGRRDYAAELLDVTNAVTPAELGVAGAGSSPTNFTELYNYHGPTPVMNFGQFVSASGFLNDVSGSFQLCNYGSFHATRLNLVTCLE